MLVPLRRRTTRAPHVAFAEIAWSAASSDQVHRLGSEQGFTAWYLVGDDTIDALVLDVIAHKRVMAGQVHESVLLEVAQENRAHDRAARARLARRVQETWAERILFGG